nr:DUF1045 domain-containing protein [Granulosicoccus sp.]
RSLHNFAALTLTHQPSELTDLASECVTALENLRAPITEQDLKRRLQQALSNRQKSQLKAFGYPYIFEDFIFHMTLSSELGDNDQSFLQWLEEQYALHVTSDPVLDRIALFMQLDRNHEFTRIEEFCFEQANQATNESR